MVEGINAILGCGNAASLDMSKNGSPGLDTGGDFDPFSQTVGMADALRVNNNVMSFSLLAVRKDGVDEILLIEITFFRDEDARRRR